MIILKYKLQLYWNKTNYKFPGTMGYPLLSSEHNKWAKMLKKIWSTEEYSMSLVSCHS